MLALPRIAAAESGHGIQNRASPSGKPNGATNNPFSKILAGLRSGKATNPSAAAPKADGKADGKAGLASGALAASSARTILDRKTAPKAENRDLRGTGPRASAVKAEPPVRAAAPKADKGLKVKKGDSSSEGLDAAFVAASANPAPGKAAVPRTDQGPGGRTGNEEKDSGMERLGVREERGSGGVKVTVVDMRLKAAREVSDKRGSAKARPEGEAAGDGVKADRPVVKAENDAFALAGRSLARGDEGPAVSAPVGSSPAAAPQASADSLAARLRDGAADIVRSAQIVLRDGDSGVIRLRLEPESLGGVKIELKMTENQISGKIVVESDIAGDAFRSSIDALKDAFAECGFETTALEVEVRNGMASGPGGERGDGAEGEGDGPYWSRSLKELDAAVPQLTTAGRDGLLDVIV